MRGGQLCLGRCSPRRGPFPARFATKARRRMAEDSDLEKTEPASPRRLQKAREQGQVARSRELATFLMLVTGAAGLWIGAQAIYRGLSGVIRRGMALDPRIGGDTAAMMAQAGRQAMDALTV